MQPRMIVVAVMVLAVHSSSGYADDRQPMVRVGSKAFTESVILGEVIKQLIADSGARAQHLSQLGGTQICWKALLAGQIDCYVEYTGTIQQEILSGEFVRDEEHMRELLAIRGVTMGGQLGINNTFGLGVPEHLARDLGVDSISDLARCREFSSLKLRFSDEFLERADGWRGLQKAYGFPDATERGIDHSLSYRGLKSGSHQVTDVFTTDAELASYQVRVLKDDRGYFPFYHAVLLSRRDLIEHAPRVVLSLKKVDHLFDNPTMVGLNARVKLDGIEESRVAAEFVQSKLRIGRPADADHENRGITLITRRLLDNLVQHLTLVTISLAAAIVVAIPLGVISYCRPRLGQIILGVVGIVQTLPALAVLVFTIPLLGLGAYPAIFALFLYSLLPIVRNTYTGLSGIPENLHESGIALGLSRSARLRMIELPLASTSILAGIKTAAVINVGTATIGALVGAGGFGQPILAGIRLDNFGMVLQGAVPAAILAMAVQATFGLAEAWLIPAGLRIRN